MTQLPKKPFILVDGSSYLYRAFHALPPLTNSQGEPTGAIYGVINMLRKLLIDYAPEYMAVVFDAKGRTFRNDMFAEYKSHRPPMPDELVRQIQPLHEIIRAMGLPLLCIEGVEADDVIGTLAQQITSPVVIVTGDKDMAQLVNEHIMLVNTMTGSVLDKAGVEKKFGVPPALIIDYLALVGDSSDNIPGVPGVGPKTAARWLLEYGSLAALIANADKINGKAGESLRASLPVLPLSRMLATIITNVPLELDPAALKINSKNTDKLIELYQRYEFKSWLNELVDIATHVAPVQLSREKTYRIIFDKKAFEEYLAILETAELIAFDTETTSLNYMDAEIVGVSFAVKLDEAVYIPVAHDYPDAPQQLARDWVLNQLKPLLENPHKIKIGHHIKYDKNVLANYGINLQGIDFDTMLESYVMNSIATRHNMDSLAAKYLGYKTITYEDIAGKGVKQLPFNQIEIEKAGQYAAEDADIVLQLHKFFWHRITAQPGLENIFTNIEMPLVPILSDMERRGVLIDTRLLAQQSQEISQRLAALEQQAYELVGEQFNLASPKQLQVILYEKMQLPILQKTPTGQPSTSEDILQELADRYPLPRIILEHRGLSKLKSTYTDRLPEQINAKTGRVHTSYHQAVAATGRLSSSDPNLQNIPIRNEEGRRIRKAFIASPGYKIVAADYSQIELRIMAHLSQDPSLLNAFANDLDIHKATAAEIFSIDLDEVTSEQRRSAKAINFGLIYGMSAFGLAQQLGISRYDAQNYMDIYFKRYPGVAAYMENTRKLAKQQGYVETISGRRLYLPEINARQQARQRAAERAAINAPLQGTAADIIKLAMISIFKALQQQQIKAHMIMQVHDELVFEVAENELAKATQLIDKTMAQAAQLAVPLVVDIGVGDNWDEAH